jgi:hypothetical protein
MAQVHEQIKRMLRPGARSRRHRRRAARKSCAATGRALMVDRPAIGRFAGSAGYAPLTAPSLRALCDAVKLLG